MKRSWRLNERHYGALQGKDKAQTLAEYGPEQFRRGVGRTTFRRPLWPTMTSTRKPMTRVTPISATLPRTECLKDVGRRMLPYWFSDITVGPGRGKTVLVTAHGQLVARAREAPRQHLG